MVFFRVSIVFFTSATARLAQSAERKALNLVVVGSSPAVGVDAVALVIPRRPVAACVHHATHEAPCRFESLACPALISCLAMHGGTSIAVPRGPEPRTLRLLAVRSNQLSYETS